MSTWKRQAIEGMAGVFSDKVKKAENKDGEIKDLHAKIGQLAVENDFLSQGIEDKLNCHRQIHRDEPVHCPAGDVYIAEGVKVAR